MKSIFLDIIISFLSPAIDIFLIFISSEASDLCVNILVVSMTNIALTYLYCA